MEYYGEIQSGELLNNRITNGSEILIGINQPLHIYTDQHFNWFQKKMIKFFFGLTVKDYTDAR